MSGHTAERISFPRWWVQKMRDGLFEMTLPSGPLGDWAFLFREMLNDALNEPPVDGADSHADLVKALEEILRLSKPGQTISLAQAIDILTDIWNASGSARATLTARKVG